MSMARSKFKVAAGIAGCVLSAFTLTGCGVGKGAYTSEGAAIAQERMNTLHAANAWDMARQQFLAGDLRKAMKNVDESIEINPAVPKSHSLRGRILIELGSLDQAVDSFKKALATDPTFYEAYYYLGFINERFSKFQEALEHYQTASSLAPSNPQYVLAASEMLIELERLKEAEELLNSRRSTFEHSAGLRQTLGHILMMRDQPEKAVEVFNEARLLAPDDVSIYEDLLLAQIASGDFADAEYSVRRLLQNPEYEDRIDLQHARARCLKELDRPTEARSILLKLIRTDLGQSDVQVWIDLGEVALKVRDFNRVRLVAARLVSIAPSKPEGYLFMAMYQREQGSLKAALSSLNQAIARSDGDATVFMLRGLILMDLGRPDLAAQSFNDAVALDPSNTTAHQMLSSVPDDE